MKKGGFIIMGLFCLFLNKNLFAYSDPSTWSVKKTIRINLYTDFIAKRERYSEKCYLDGGSYSAGFGDASWCEQSMKVLRHKNPFLKLRSDEYVRSLVRIPMPIAKWRLKKFIIEIYDRLETYTLSNRKVVDILDEKELLSLIDNIYTRGETRFYKSDLWNDFVINYIKTGKMDCIKIAHAFLSQSKNTNKRQRAGVVARRFVEMLDFTHRSCVYDVKFLQAVLNKY